MPPALGTWLLEPRDSLRSHTPCLRRSCAEKKAAALTPWFSEWLAHRALPGCTDTCAGWVPVQPKKQEASSTDLRKTSLQE